MIIEDPHVTVFDGGQVSLEKMPRGAGVAMVVAARTPEGFGEKWLVKSLSIFIQGKYDLDSGLPVKNSFMRSIAVGGPFLKNNILVIESLDGLVKWNGRQILASMPSDFSIDGLIIARSRADASLVGHEAQRSPGLEVELPSNVRILVNRYQRHVNAAITMNQTSEPQDGLCGNFNSYSADDAPELVNKRKSEEVEASDSLFV